METETKRLFFALEVQSLWPSHYPDGRLLCESDRHLTIAFLGETPYLPLLTLLNDLPYNLQIGTTGYFDKVLLLPSKHPRVVAWHGNLLYDFERICSFYCSFTKWLVEHQFSPSHPDRSFLPHTTLCRAPFPISNWKKQFHPLPFYISHFHLYESVGNLRYKPLWTQGLTPPFEEIEHTADIAFRVRGTHLPQLYQNAMMAMAFHDPKYLNYFNFEAVITSLDDIVILLNEAITHYDSEEGAPHKAVSFHGSIEEGAHYLEWEMIIDV